MKVHELSRLGGWKAKLTIWWTAATVLGLCTRSAGAQESAADTSAKIDQSVVARLRSMYGTTSTIIRHVDLTKPFGTTSQWDLVVAKEPDKPHEGSWDDPGAVSVCFVKNGVPDCPEKLFLEKFSDLNGYAFREGRAFYEFFAAGVVYSRTKEALPLLLLQTCTMPGGNGSCDISTFLFDYDRPEDRFHPVFFNLTGRNNNQETRFVESGPLLGDVIVAYPTLNAPFTYYVEVYKRSATGKYVRVLRYRGRTEYGDGNRLAVIDSEMPEILQRLGVWKRGDTLPVPPAMPAGCARLFMRKGVEWCE